MLHNIVLYLSMKHLLFIIISIIIGCTSLFGQKINFYGSLSDYDSKTSMAGVNVTVLDGSTVVATATSAADGSYSVKFPPGKTYLVKFEKRGYVAKHIKIETEKINPELMPPGGKIMPSNHIDLFTKRGEDRFDFLKDEPVVVWYFDGSQMNYDSGQVNRIKRKIDDALKAASETIADNDANYKTLIAEADVLYNQKKYKEALNKYIAAIKIQGKATEQYPNAQIVKIDNLLQKKAEEELAYKQAHEEYFNLIKAADLLANNKDFVGAIAKYREASDLDPSQQYPKERISELTIAQRQADNLEEYNTLISRADAFVEQKSFRAARDNYQEALKLFPNNKYPKDQLAMLQAKIDAKMEQLEQTEKYNDAVKTGDELFKQNKYKEAVAKYQEALTYEPAATYPQQQIDKANAATAEQDKFNLLVKQGDKSVGIKDYQTAINKYTEALTLFENDTVKNKLNNTQQLLISINKDAKKQAKFDSLVTLANKSLDLKAYQDAVNQYNAALVIQQDDNIISKRDNAKALLLAVKNLEKQKNVVDALLNNASQHMNKKEFELAISTYDSVLVINSQEAIAIEGKSKAQKLLKELQANQANQKKFDNLVAQADKAFDKEVWEDAKTKYMAAKAILSNNQHVNDRIDTIQATLQEQLTAKNLEEEIFTLLAQAQEFEADNDWKNAITKYEAALNLNQERKDISEMIEVAKGKQKAWLAQQDEALQFSKLKSEGVHFMNNEDWNKAKEKFEAAILLQEDEEIKGYLKQIDEQIAVAKKASEIEQQYQNKMSEGLDFEASEQYKEAISSFKDALKIKENDPTAKSRIKDIQQKLQNTKNSQEKLAIYQKAINKGKKALTENDYAGAIKYFDDALLAKPLDKEASRLKNEAQDKINTLKEQEEKYQKQIDLGQKAYELASNNDNDTTLLIEAKQHYEKAQEIKSQASLPQQKIVEIDQLLRQIAENKENTNKSSVDEKYKEQLDLAKIAAQDERFEQAITHLEKALTFKPEETLPKENIVKYQALLDEKNMLASINRKYDSLIALADKNFGSANYKKSISEYQSALQIKQKEKYPQKQIQKAQEAIVNTKYNTKNQEYSNWISQADASFLAKNYEKAIGYYQSALGVKPKDEYALKKIKKSNFLIQAALKKNRLAAANDAEYQKYIIKADTLFNQTDFVAALKQYQQALEVKNNDVYANSRVKLCIAKAKEKTERNNDQLYQQIITKADEYFNNENYDKASNLYERALKLRDYDKYPQDQLDKIIDIKNGTAKRNIELADLGEPTNISILEGAALLQKGEEQRKQIKLSNIKKQIHKNEGIARKHANKDYQNRMNFQDEVIDIKDRAQQDYLDHKDEHRATVNRVDKIQQDYEKQMERRSNYETGSVLRTQQEVNYLQDDMDNKKRDLTANHRNIVEQIKEIRRDKDEQTRAELAKDRVNVGNVSNEIERIKDKAATIATVNQEKEQDLAVTMDEITHNMEKRAHAERNDLKSHALQMQRNVILAQIKDAESKSSKLAVQDQIREDIKALAANLQRKSKQETQENYQRQLAVDAQLNKVQAQYDKAKEGQEIKHQQIVAQVKQVRRAQDVQMQHRAAEQYADVQNAVGELENIRKIQEEAARQQGKDLSELNEVLKSQRIAIEQTHQLKEDEEVNTHQNVVKHLNRIRKDADQAKVNKQRQIEENYEEIKGLEASIESNERIQRTILKSRKREIQDAVNKLEGNQRTQKALIPNSIGDKYPEGVTQENYIRRDQDGIPVKLVTRRIVVQGGHGDVYIRIQTRSGITYSKNGASVSQNAWIQGTQRADLVKHY